MRTPPDVQRRSRLTVQGWLLVVLVAMGVVMLSSAVVGSVFLRQTNDKSDLLIHTVQPARTAAFQMQSALIDQETAVRGYAISADPRFMEPYEAGQETEKESVAQLRSLLRNYPDLLADVTSVEQTVARFRTNAAEKTINAVLPGTPRVVDPGLLTTGKTEFDRVRAAVDRLHADLVSLRQNVVDELTAKRQLRDAVLAGTIGVFLLTALLLVFLVRGAVTRPLAELAQACRRTTEEGFESPITAQGPKDIHGIATDAEKMRQRFIETLRAAEESHQTIAQQARELDVQTRELSRSNAELEQFAFVASHDLQEPLRKVASFCQLLKKRYGDALDERGLQYIDFAVDGASRMQILINDLLAFSRVGRELVAHTEVDMASAIDSAIRNLGTTISESKASVVVNAVSMPTVAGDPTLLTLLWQNLIGNAVKFRKPNVVPIIVIDFNQDDSGDFFSVTDNGIGIEAEFSDKVFIIFQRLHSREAYSGTGIGLAMCRKIVEHHGGRIWIDHTYTDGSRFCFTLTGAGRPVEPAEGVS